MSYRAGIGQGMEAVGFAPREPHIVCDGCGTTHGVGSRSSYAANWFLARRPPPGWRGLRTNTLSVDPKRWDLCPSCWRGPEQTKEEANG